MASVMPLVLDPPTAVVERRGRVLADVILPFPEPEQLGGDAMNRAVTQRWRQGVTFQPRPLRQWTMLDESYCADHTKDLDTEFESAVTGAAFTAYKAIQCSTLSTTFDEFRSFLATDARVGASNILARRLMDASLTLNVPDAATVAIGGGPLGAVRAVGSIDHELNLALHGGRGIILIDPQSAAVAHGVLDSDGDGNLYSPSGHDVIIHSEFLVEATADSGGAYGDDDGVVYGLGPIYGTITDALILEHGNLLEGRNIGTILAEVYGLLAFDPNTVFSQRVALPTS